MMDEKDFETFVKTTLDNVAAIIVAKNKDYGNAAERHPVLCPNVSPYTALKVRLSDKIARLANDSEKTFETEVDTIIDIVGYCVLLLQNLKELKK